MRIIFDSAKDAKNIAAHGVSLAIAEKIKWDAELVNEDTRKNYGETRMIGFAPIGDRLFCVVYVDRADGRRIISLRKANLREFKKYVESQT